MDFRPIVVPCGKTDVRVLSLTYGLVIFIQCEKAMNVPWILMFENNPGYAANLLSPTVFTVQRLRQRINGCPVCVPFAYFTKTVEPFP